jgi:hypothetical protein
LTPTPQPSLIVPLTPPSPPPRRSTIERTAAGFHIGNLDIRVVVSPPPPVAPAAIAPAATMSLTRNIPARGLSAARRLARGFGAFGMSQA